MITTFAYHASHEQFTPSDLLRWSLMAKDAGFQGINSSDHFHPWSERQWQSGFAFAWMGAVMQATRLPCGVVCAPGQRYHPAFVAQAIATLAQMFPGRCWMSLGSAEALNGLKEERNARLRSADIIKRLLYGESVTHAGLVTVNEAKLYTRPDGQPLFLGAALSEKTAEWMGSWSDGMITIYQPEYKLRPIIDAFQRSGEKENRCTYRRSYPTRMIMKKRYRVPTISGGQTSFLQNFATICGR
jgi:coenzyme F420-dependent glucose-6-phosphate dehydrogenase